MRLPCDCIDRAPYEAYSVPRAVCFLYYDLTEVRKSILYYFHDTDNHENFVTLSSFHDTEI